MLTNDSQIADLGIQRSPAQTSQGDVSLEHLTRRLVQELGEDGKSCQGSKVDQCASSNSQSLKNDIGDEEVRCFGQVLGKKVRGAAWIVDNISDNG